MFTAISNLGVRETVALLALTLCPLYYVSFSLRSTHSLSFPSPFQSESSNASRSSIEAWMDNDLLGPFDPTPIREYCAKVSWRPNLVFRLDGSVGGIGNVRAHVLDFTLFAMDTGASIILPKQTLRSTSDLFDIWHGRQANFSRMFDEQAFREIMADACPQMHIYQVGENEGLATIIEDGYDPKSRRVDFDPANTAEAAYAYTTTWLSEHNVNEQVLSQVSVRHTMWEVDTRSLGSEFRRNFGLMFPFRKDVRRYAAIAMERLASKHELPMKPSDRLYLNSYYGAHLRTEQDTISAGWFNPDSATEVGFNYTQQTDAYLAHAAEHSLSVMYVATGNATELERFRIKAAESTPPVNVTSKWDLLPDKDAAALAELDWDQQALVDIEILMRCSVFGGFAKSSFSIAIATARNAYLEARGRPLGYNWRMREVNNHWTFEDSLSRILGRNELNERWCPRGCWP